MTTRQVTVKLGRDGMGVLLGGSPFCPARINVRTGLDVTVMTRDAKDDDQTDAITADPSTDDAEHIEQEKNSLWEGFWILREGMKAKP